MMGAMTISPRPRTANVPLSDLADLSPMASLIVCVARSYAATRFVESAKNNRDAWTDELWSCYHPYGNYGSYCVVGAYAVIRTAFDLAARSGTACIHGFPTRPAAGPGNRERTLYGNVYRTLMEIERAGIVPTGREPEVGAMFCRASNDAGHNHAGIVIETPMTDAHYITTVEANTTISGGSGNPKAFVTVTYSRAAYERYVSRPFTKSSDAARNYAGTQITGWRFAYFHRLCNLAAMPDIPAGYKACLGVDIVCEVSRLPVPSPPTCDITKPPKAAPDDDNYQEWQLFSNVYPRTLPNGTVQTRPDANDAQVSPDGCWVRYKRGVSLLPPDAAPPTDAPPCKETFLLKSACDPQDGQGPRTVLRFATTDGVVTPQDLRDYGVCEAIMSSVITRDDHMGRGYSQRAKAVYDYVPMIRLDNCNAFVLSESSEMFRIFEQFSLWGPNPRIVSIDRTRFSGGTGGGWAERLGRWLHPEGPKLFFPESSLDGVLDRQGSYYAMYVLRGIGLNQKRLDARDPFYSYKFGDIAENGFDISLFDLLLEWDKRAKDRAGQNLVIVWRGDPITVWDAVRGPLRVISGLIPGVGPIFNVVSTTIDTIRAAQGTAIDVAFTLTNGIAAALGSGILGETPFGVDASVFRDIQSTSQRANAVYRTLQASRGQSGVQAALAVAREFGRQFPEVTSAVQREFADEERWIRNAASEVDRWWNGALGDVRSTVHGIADSWSAQAMGSLISLQQGVESTFAHLVADATSITKSATQIPYVQELLLTKADASLLALVPGVNKVAGNILKVSEIFRQDVTDAVVHSALAGLATGKQVIDGALDGLVLSSLLNKAEDFARRGWDFSLPITMQKDKAACFAHEVRVVTGLECCTPKKYVCGSCIDPQALTACPPGQYRDSDGCCVERPILPNGDAPGTTGEGERTGTGPGIGPGTGPTGRDDQGMTHSDGPILARGPDVLPPCIRVVGGGYRYCPPPYCGVRPGATSSRPQTQETEQATIQLTNSNGGAFELRATRSVGTLQWGQFEARAMQPSGNGWVPSLATFQAVDARNIIAGTVMTPEMFEAMRVSQRAEPVRAGLSDTLIVPGGGPLPAIERAMQQLDMPPGSKDASIQPRDASAVPKDASTVPMDARESAVLPTCTVMYEARYSDVPYPQWHARIGARWTEIVDCCPRTDDGCCQETSRELAELRRAVGEATAEARRTRTLVTAMTEQQQAMSEQQRNLSLDVQKIMAAVLRCGAGEQVDVSDIRRDLAFIRSQLPMQPTQYDDAVLLVRIGELERAVRELRIPGAYDDAALRRDITDLRRVVEARCQQCETRNYDPRFDSIEAMIRAIVLPPPVILQGGTTPLQAAVDYRPYFESVQRTLAEIRTATGTNYDEKFRELSLLIGQMPTVCPSCRDVDLAPILAVLARIEQNTLRNYDSEFAAIRQLMKAMTNDGVRDYDARFDELERRIALIRVAESKDYTERFSRLDTVLDAIRTALPRDRAYDDYFTAIQRNLDALLVRPTQNTPTAGQEHQAQNCDYRWDEVLRLLQEIRSLALSREGPTRADSFAAYTATLEKLIGEATTRVTTATDHRYDDVVRLVQGLRAEMASRPDCPVPQADPRLDEITRLLMELQSTSAMMTTSIRKSQEDLALLRENAAKMDTAYARQMGELRTAIRTTGGTTDILQALERAQTEWRYQQARYEEEITGLTRRLDDVQDSMKKLPSSNLPPRPVPPAEPPYRPTEPPYKPKTRPARGHPVKRTQTYEERECDDCPTLVERHERYVYGPLPTGGTQRMDDECDEPCE